MDIEKRSSKIIIYVCNTAEFLLDYILESDIESDLPFLYRLGDRSAMWQGLRKLLITSVPIPHLEYWKELFGVDTLINLSPNLPTRSLCDDVVREKDLLNQIVGNCIGLRTVDLIPYGTTPQFFELADHLERALNSVAISLVLPESPERESFWLLQYFNSKAGFRQLIAEWFGNQLPCKLPKGYVVNDYSGIRIAVKSFLTLGKGCICKPSVGVSGLGQVRFLPNTISLTDDLIEKSLLSSPYMQHTPIIVEELISCDLSPSGEAYVPKSDFGDVQLTCNFANLFSDNNIFNGVLIDRMHLPYVVEQKISDCLRQIGMRLQRLGYAGILNLDFAVDRIDGTVYLLEANLRRTGGTHVHETASLLFGNEYIDNRTVLSIHDINLPHPMNWNDLTTNIHGIMFPMGSLQVGMVISSTSSLPDNMAYIIFGRDIGHVKQLQSMFWDAVNK